VTCVPIVNSVVDDTQIVVCDSRVNWESGTASVVHATSLIGRIHGAIVEAIVAATVAATIAPCHSTTLCAVGVRSIIV